MPASKIKMPSSIFVVHCLRRFPDNPHAATVDWCDMAYLTKEMAMAFVEENSTLSTIYWWEETPFGRFTPKKRKEVKRKTYDELAEDRKRLIETVQLMLACKACAGDKDVEHTCDISSAQALLREIK